MLTWNPLKRMRMHGAGKHVGRAALATSRSLIQLLAGLQQHRGVSSTWLAGDKSFESRMLERRRAIESLLPALRPGFSSEAEAACPCFILNDWKLFEFEWREMIEQLPQSSVHQNIERHNQLIARLLDWLGAVGESRLELPAEGCLAPGMVRNFAARLPALSECLGQARALGSSVAAQGGCSPVARVRLTFLVARAEALLDRAVSADAGAHVPESAQRLVRAMATMVRTELLLSTGVRISSERYFAAATQAIDAVFAWIDSLGAKIELTLRAGAAGREQAAAWRPVFG